VHGRGDIGDPAAEVHHRPQRSTGRDLLAKLKVLHPRKIIEVTPSAL